MEEHQVHEKQKLPPIKVPKNPLVILSILFLAFFVLMWVFSVIRGIVSPFPDVQPTPTTHTQQNVSPGWERFSDKNINFSYPQGYTAIMRDNLYYAIYKNEQTATGEAGIFIDLRREGSLSDFDTAVAEKRKQLEFVNEQQFRNGIQLSGQIAEGLGKGLPLIVTLLPYDAGALSVETSGKRINTAVYQGILTSLDFSTAPTTFNIPVAITRARNDLATKLNVRPTEIEIVKTEPMEWNNSGLGCEEPGEITLQVVTPGYRVEFNYNDTIYIYHTDQRETFRACDN